MGGEVCSLMPKACVTPIRSIVFSLAALTTLLAMLVFATGAHAGSYEVRACDSSGVNRSFVSVGSSMVAANGSCGAAPLLGMQVRNGLGPGTADPFTWGALEAVAPAGSVITGLRARATAYDQKAGANLDGWRAGIADDSGYRWCGIPSPCAWSGAPSLPIALDGLSTTRLRLLVICALGSGCRRNAVQATTTLSDVILRIRDDQAPTISAMRGALASGDSWVTGSIPSGFDASDPAGIRTSSVSVDGTTLGGGEHLCDQYSMSPCPNGGAETTIDTRQLSDGAHSVLARAVDAAGNAADQQAQVRVDNTAPVVARPERSGGGGWSADANPALLVDASDGAGGSGVSSLGWELCRTDGSDCRSGTAIPTPALSLNLPAAGEWHARVTASDALRAGQPSAWSPPLRYDPLVPGASQLAGARRWSDGRTQASVQLAPSQAAPQGPSGIAGYAVTRDGSAPGSAPSVGGEKATFSLGELAEGTTTVTARAISGAGVAASELGRAEVGIDRSAPALTLAPAAGEQPRREEWFPKPIELLAKATDQAALSGMTAAPEAEPLENGGYVEYQVDDGPPQRVRGANASISLADDGIHAVSARAVDVAGNASAPQTVSYRIDSHRPTGSLTHPAASDPRRLTAAVDEGCIASAVLELRRVGERNWEYIEGHAESRAVSGLVADDSLPAGEYQARFRVVDCAGNEGMVTQFADGSPGLITLPLRMHPTLRASLPHSRGSAKDQLTVALGKKATVEGLLIDSRGLPMVGTDVELRERVGSGAWRSRAARTSNRDGRVRITFTPSTSRALQLVAEQSITSTGAASNQLRIDVPAVVTIHVARRSLRNGQAARFSGRLAGGNLPKKGREIELQGYNPLRRVWQPVRTEGLRCDRYGRWRSSYRFTATVGRTVTYRFRVRVAPRPDHPFAQGHSRSVAVRVHG
jgi:hypothetical protein